VIQFLKDALVYGLATVGLFVLVVAIRYRLITRRHR
jgi:hypothetical protein